MVINFLSYYLSSDIYYLPVFREICSSLWNKVLFSYYYIIITKSKVKKWSGVRYDARGEGLLGPLPDGFFPDMIEPDNNEKYSHQV